MFMRTYASSRLKRKSFYRISELQMFSGGHMVHWPKLYTKKVRETFWQITQKLLATKTWELEELFMY